VRGRGGFSPAQLKRGFHVAFDVKVASNVRLPNADRRGIYEWSAKRFGIVKRRQ